MAAVNGASAVAGIKQEDALQVKLPPGVLSPAKFADDDGFEEDTGELQYPPKAENDDGQDKLKLWIARIPPYLWEAWKDIDEDEEIQIGTMKVWQRLDANGKQKMRLELREDFKKHQDVPKLYDMNMTNPNAQNIFVFSEKDQPESTRGGRYHGMLNPENVQRDPRTGEKRKRPYGVSIPKQTSLVGYGGHEVTCLAVENEEYHNLTAKRARKFFQPKHNTKILFQTFSDQDKQEALNLANLQRDSDRFKNFIAKKPKTRENKTSQDNKAVRMPQNELLDLLMKCFERYKYWSMRALRQETRQPESYLKDALQKIARLIRSGPFATHWELTEEYQAGRYQNMNVKEETAPDADEDMATGDEGGDSGDVDEEEDDNVDMEEVKL